MLPIIYQDQCLSKLTILWSFLIFLIYYKSHLFHHVRYEVRCFYYMWRNVIENPIHHDCYFCGQIRGDADQDLIASMLPSVPYRRRVILENELFAVIPSLGALTPGHVLLCTRSHIRSFASIEWDKATADAYRAIRIELIERIQASYGGVIHLFEHGMATTGEHIPCTIDHAHLHLLPVRLEVPVLDDEAWSETDVSIETLGRHTRGYEYLYHECPSAAVGLRLGPPGIFGSQVLRQHFATFLDCDNRWDWRTHPNAALADEIFESLHPKLTASMDL